MQAYCQWQIRLHALYYSKQQLFFLSWTQLLHSIRFRTVLRCCFHFTNIKRKETIYLWLWSHSFPCDKCCCTEPSRSTFPLCVRWEFLRENQTKSDKRNISPGVLTIESSDVFCLQQPSSLLWTLSVTSLETISDCVGNVFVCVRLSSEGEYYVCGGGLMRQACRLHFCVVNHLRVQ